MAGAVAPRAVAVAVCGVITVGILHYMHKYADKLSERWTLVLVSLLAAAALLLSLVDLGWWGFAVILTLYAGEYILYTFMSEVLNNNAPERHRATVLSVSSFLRMFPYACLAPVVGYLSTNGNLEYFLVVWPLLICGAIALYLATRRRDAKIKVQSAPEAEPVV